MYKKKNELAMNRQNGMPPRTFKESRSQKLPMMQKRVEESCHGNGEKGEGGEGEGEATPGDQSCEGEVAVKRDAIHARPVPMLEMLVMLELGADDGGTKTRTPEQQQNNKGGGGSGRGYGRGGDAHCGDTQGKGMSEAGDGRWRAVCEPKQCAAGPHVRGRRRERTEPTPFDERPHLPRPLLFQR